MKLFQLVRTQDHSGVSGTGVVAQGVIFDDGTCTMRWLTDTASTAVYDSIRDLEVIHGHGGSTEVRYVDGVTPDDPDLLKEILTQIGLRDGWNALQDTVENTLRLVGYAQASSEGVVEEKPGWFVERRTLLDGRKETAEGWAPDALHMQSTECRFDDRLYTPATLRTGLISHLPENMQRDSAERGIEERLQKPIEQSYIDCLRSLGFEDLAERAERENARAGKTSRWWRAA